MGNMDKLNEYFNIAVEKVLFYAPKVALAAIIFWIGFKIIKKLVQIVDVGMAKAGFNDSIRPFLVSIIEVILKVAVLMVIANVLGANLTGLVAILAAAGFAIGMALQGSLGNFASGILILTLKPYKVEDWVTIGDKFGRVEEISIFNTILVSPGQKTLIIPNSKVTDDIVTNYSKKDMIRLELEVTMPYEEDFPRVKEVIQKALKNVPKILDEPVTDIGISTYDSHSIKIAVLPFVKPDDFWEVTYNCYSEIKKAFHNNNIKVAYSEGVEMGSIGG
jgi:small conductance mechanosensitive channel